MCRTEFIVQLKTIGSQPVIADGYTIDGEALVFLNQGNEIAALFDMSIVEGWEPRSPEYELPLSTET